MANYQLVDIDKLESDLTIVADAIRNKAGITGKLVFPVGMAVIAEGISTNDTTVEDALVGRTLSVYTNKNALSVGENAFLFFNSLTSVTFLKASLLNTAAFQQCFGLETASFPEAIDIGEYAFDACEALTNINFPKAKNIRVNAFAACVELTLANFPAATSIGDGAFSGCTKLASISFPAASDIKGYAFAYCNSLENVTFPLVTKISGSAFINCTKLSTISFAQITTIGSKAFSGCTNLSKIYVMTPTVCKLSNSNAFSGTGITSTTGSIFVKASLLSSYKKATNWAYFSNRIYSN